MHTRLESIGLRELQFTHSGVSLNYVVGPNNGDPLVLIPAQTGTWESYQKVLPELSKKFQVFAVDIRGHGKSSWTTGDYSWKSVGEDLAVFLQQIVQRPAMISGNSSGGIIALWLATQYPELVTRVILEDAPLFSVEMPRFKEHDKFVYNGLVHLVENIGDVEHRDLANYFKNLELPLKNGGVKRMPDWVVRLLSYAIARYQKRHPGEPVDIWYFPLTLRLLIKSISQFDPDFARAFVDGRFYEGVDHETLLKKVRCPILLLHASWFRHPKVGLIGALDDKDVEHAQRIQPALQYKQIKANHVIHMFKPQDFISAVEQFSSV